MEKDKLGTLILNDKRASLIANTYFKRLKPKLADIPAKDSVVQLGECGNHSQGAIFLNGEYLYSQQLLERFEKISKKVPYLYFARFDIRYQDSESLKEGKHFEIVEINCAGAEATHIWDTRTNLIDAYKVLYQQWSYLFEIGHQLKKEEHKINLKELAKECFKVFKRNDELSVSS